MTDLRLTAFSGSPVNRCGTRDCILAISMSFRPVVVTNGYCNDLGPTCGSILITEPRQRRLSHPPNSLMLPKVFCLRDKSPL